MVIFGLRNFHVAGLLAQPNAVMQQRPRGPVFALPWTTKFFGANAVFKPVKIYRLARAKAYLSRGVRVEWDCAPDLLTEDMNLPANSTFYYPNGVADRMAETTNGKPQILPKIFAGNTDWSEDSGFRAEWALTFLTDENGAASDDGFLPAIVIPLRLLMAEHTNLDFAVQLPRV